CCPAWSPRGPPTTSLTDRTTASSRLGAARSPPASWRGRAVSPPSRGPTRVDRS
ncbi:MAG: hypothetical protein AVDCRST_MAG60-349, partial [uncultured Nocardioides sp.]